MHQHLLKCAFLFLQGCVATSAMAVEPEVYVLRLKHRLANLECPATNTGLIAWTDVNFEDQDTTKEPDGAWTGLLDIRDGKPARLRLRLYIRNGPNPRQSILFSATFDEAGQLISEDPPGVEKGARNSASLGIAVMNRFCSGGKPIAEAQLLIADVRRKIGWPWPDIVVK